MELTEIITQSITAINFHGLIFLLGSFTVASLSDLRRMAAQQDFAEVWAVYAGLMFFYDLYLSMTGAMPATVLAAKWLIILAFAVTATNQKIHFNISLMDIAAITALISTLTPAYIIATLILLLITGELLNPILKPFGQAGAYPYLPVVLTTTILVLLIHTTGIIQINPPITPQ
ncbi:MAG: hypothetical protein NTU61_02895 [Candidatus Altiarchaeota archaeon]|nr:hypothetical protein [Candidatus Altiarchaeota archaeon]